MPRTCLPLPAINHDGGLLRSNKPVRIAVFQPKGVCTGISATYECQLRFLGGLNESFQELEDLNKSVDFVRNQHFHHTPAKYSPVLLGCPLAQVVFEEMFLSTLDPRAQSTTFDILQYQAKRFSRCAASPSFHRATPRRSPPLAACSSLLLHPRHPAATLWCPSSSRSPTDPWCAPEFRDYFTTFGP